MVAKAALVRAITFSGTLSMAFLLAAVTGHAQAPPSPLPAQTAQQPRPVTGFVSSYEILRTVRAAGFDPLAPPLREGTTYVLRATDFRGILMRVVLDARTGVIRDVTRIVAAAPGPYGMIAPPHGPRAYASEPYGPPPYGAPAAPAEYESPNPDMGAGEETVGPPSPRSPAVSTATRPVTSARPSLPSLPPLPRPRPASLASQKSETSGKVEVPGPPAHSANLQPQTGASADAVGVNRGAAPTSLAAPGKLPSLPPFND